MKKTFLLIFTFVVSMFSNSAWAEPQVFINIQGVQGESQVISGWIDASTFSFNIQDSSSSSAGGGFTPPNFSTISISRNFDSTSAILATALVMGSTYSKAMIEVREMEDNASNPTGQLIMRMELKQITVKSVDYSAGAGFPTTEIVTIDFNAIKMTPYSNAGQTAGTPFSWDRAANRSF